MNIVVGQPPNIEELRKAFEIAPTVIFAYGDTIFNPAGKPIPEHRMAHEEVHGRQQAIVGVEEWWRRFIVDPVFRLDQELEAYRVQWEYIAARANRGQRRRLLHQLAADLASGIYGKVISISEAEKLICP